LPAVKGLRLRSNGAVEQDSIPPASTTLLIPAAIWPAATAIAVRLDAHCRLTAIPGTPVNPRSTAT